MYKFRPISPRMQSLRQRIRDRVIQTDAERAVITTEAYKKYNGAPAIIRNAYVLYEICDKMTLRVEDEDVIVCNMARNFCGTAINPEYGCGWMPLMIDAGVYKLGEDGLYHNLPTDEIPFTMSPEDYKTFHELMEYWNGKTYTDIFNTWLPESYQELGRLRCSHATPGPEIVSLPGGHTTPGFRKIVDKGYGSIRKQAEEWLEAHKGRYYGDEAMKQYMFYTSVVIVCDAAKRLTERYAEECLKKAELVSDEKRRAELVSMASSLRWLGENPARTFRESVQAQMTYIMILLISGMTDIGSCGRFDQIHGKYLKADLAAGRITLDEAQEIVDNFFLNISRNWSATLPELAKIIGVGNTYMHTTVGGVDPETGRDAINEVTFMVLETMGRLGLHDPTVTLRLTKDSPQEIYDCAIECTKLVGGLPLYYNDEVVVPGIKKEMGWTIQEARDYALIGYQEITGSGFEYACCNGIIPPHGAVYYNACLTMALNDGRNPMNGEQSSLHTGFLYDMKSMEEVKEAYLKMADHALSMQTELNNYNEYMVEYNMCQPQLSISMEGCMEKGRDVTWGGAKYTSFGGTGTGLATVADSLCTIEYACFDKKICTTRELYDAMMANWEGHEDLRQRLLAEVPHFGNSDPYADKWMKFATESYADLCASKSSHYAKYYRAGLYGAADHVSQGYVTWATPDGRLSGTPIADAASPAQGRDKNGPTAVLVSSCCYNHHRFMDGVCLNLRIHPSVLSREDGVKKLSDMIKTYHDMGGAEVQFNVVSSETMRKAQADPDEYRDLVVRIAGYSAYFVELTTDQQNDLISRNENVI